MLYIHFRISVRIELFKICWRKKKKKNCVEDYVININDVAVYLSAAGWCRARRAVDVWLARIADFPHTIRVLK